MHQNDTNIKTITTHNTTVGVLWGIRMSRYRQDNTFLREKTDQPSDYSRRTIEVHFQESFLVVTKRPSTESHVDARQSQIHFFDVQIVSACKVRMCIAPLMF